MGLPEPPKLQRRIASPGRVAALVLLFALLPISALIGVGSSEAQRSVLHVAASFAVLMLAFRLIGKRELGRLSPFELVTLMLIPEIFSNSLQGESPLLPSLAGLSTMLLLVFGTSLLAQRFAGVQRVVEAEPTLLVADGKMLEDAMNRERIAPDELFSEMRKQGLEHLSQVRLAVLETSGNVTFVAKEGPTVRAQEAAE